MILVAAMVLSRFLSCFWILSINVIIMYFFCKPSPQPFGYDFALQSFVYDEFGNLRKIPIVAMSIHIDLSSVYVKVEYILPL